MKRQPATPMIEGAVSALHCARDGERDGLMLATGKFIHLLIHLRLTVPARAAWQRTGSTESNCFDRVRELPL